MRRSAPLAAGLVFSVFLAVPAVSAKPAPSTTDLTSAFRACGVTMAGLQVTKVGDIVVIRGQALDAAQAAMASAVAGNLGYTRVANLAQVILPADDENIERAAERELSMHRSLDGCHLSVDSQNGVVHLAGTVNHEQQKDMAIAVIRRLNGVRSVQSDLRF
ncbi:MAG: BON domain-containing protein [Thermoanaerobaculia bacterium]